MNFVDCLVADRSRQEALPQDSTLAGGEGKRFQSGVFGAGRLQLAFDEMEVASGERSKASRGAIVYSGAHLGWQAGFVETRKSEMRGERASLEREAERVRCAIDIRSE